MLGSSALGALAEHFVGLGFGVKQSAVGDAFWVDELVAVWVDGGCWDVMLVGYWPVSVEIALPDSVERVEGLVRGWFDDIVF